jgi:uncharacterized membrane protein YbhN (UPF0104 family)
VFDMACVLSCATAAVVLMMDARTRSLVAAGADVVHGIVAVGALVVASIAVVYLAAKYLPRWFASGRFVRFERALKAVVDGLLVIRQPRCLIEAGGLSLVAWMLNALVMVSLLAAVGITASPVTILLLLGLSGIAAAIPAAPANIGTLQFAFVLALAPHGHPSAQALAAASLVQIVLLGSVTLAGAVVYGACHLMPRGRASND